MTNQRSRRTPYFVALWIGLAATSVLAMAPPPGASPGAAQETEAFLPGECIVQLAAEDLSSAGFDPGRLAAGRTGLARLDRGLAAIQAVSLTPVFEPGADPAARALAGLDRIFLIRFQADLSPVEAARLLSRTAAVVYAEPNGFYHALLTPNDTYYPSQWAHNNTGQAVRYGGGLVGTADCDTDTDAAWDLQTGSSTLILAIIDTGVDLGHPEFAGRLVAGYDYINNDSNPTDDNGHGTSCAGIAVGAGNNTQGVAGVAWGVRLMPVKVLDSAGSGSYTAVANGVTFAADNGAKILSLSLGGGASSTLQTAVDYAFGRGCAIFCASGNANRSSLDYPAAYSNTIAVGALSPCNERKSTSSCDGETWWGSNYGTGLDFLAPGVRIHTADIRGSGGFGAGDYITDFNGTSSATPHAAGIGALVWSQNPALTNSGLRSVLRSNSDDLGTAGYDTQTGYGRLNAFRAVQNAGGGGTPTPVTLFSETFEVNTVPGSVWSATDTNGSSGLDYWGDQSSSGGARVHGGSWSAYCADNSNVAGQRYDNNMRADVTLINAISLAGYSSVQLSFWLYKQTYNSSDYVAFQYWNGSSWVEQQRWSGGATGWINPVYNVTGSSIRFRFYFYSNGSSTAEGAYVDDILLTGVSGAAPAPEELHVTLADPGEEAGLAEETLGRVGESAAGRRGPPESGGTEADRTGRMVLRAAPNPLRESTALHFTLAQPADVRLEIFGADGRRIARLSDGRFGAGEHSLTWNGEGLDGTAVPSGIYYARLSLDGQAAGVRRLLRIR